MAYDKKIIKEKIKIQQIGTPSWGYGDSGTRFHVYHKPYSPRNLFERLDDASQVQKYTGVCPYVDLHTAWDEADDWSAVRRYADDVGLKIGAVNPHLFAADDYTLGSLANPSEMIRKKSVDAFLQSIGIAKVVGSKVLSMWFADGTDYPGQDDFRTRKKRMEDGLKQVYEAMPKDMKMVLEYKLFEPGFYSMDIASWGTSFILCQKLGDRAKVLVDLGHHAQGVNIEQIVAILLSEGALGGFHFNDKKSADDDLTAGSINPYQLFLIFCELVWGEIDPLTRETVQNLNLMIDENHNFKQPIEGTIQSVEAIQIAYARALLVDYEFLHKAQSESRIIHAEESLKDAYHTDVRPLLEDARREMGLDPHPIEAFRRSGYMEKIIRERA